MSAWGGEVAMASSVHQGAELPFSTGRYHGNVALRSHRRRVAPPPLDPPPSSTLFHSLVNESEDGVAIVDRHGRVAYCNTAAAELLSTTPEDLTGRDFGFPLGAQSDVTPLEIFTGDQPRFVEMRTKPLTWQDRDATLVSFRDVTREQEMDAELGMHTIALEAIANGVFITDSNGVICWANTALEKISGYRLDELIFQPASIFKSGSHDSAFYEEMWSRINSGEPWRGRVENRRKDGSIYIVNQSIIPTKDATGQLSRFVVTQEDISDWLETEDKLVRLTDYDALTGLPNRRVFMDRLRSAIERADRNKAMAAVMVMDINNFKAINNALGHDVGDALLVDVVNRISGHLRTTDTLSRLNGDIFGILMENVTDMAAANRSVRTILERSSDPLSIQGHAIDVTASIGISAYPKDDTEPSSLIRQAEIAMHKAKAESGNAFRYFDHNMDSEIRRRVSLEAELRLAVDDKQLWLAYQPQVDLESGELVGAEALLRWTHPKHGVISPGEFIPIAETSGLILPIGDWIIEEICRQSQLWMDLGVPQLKLGFNVSGVQFRQRNLVNQVIDGLSDAGLPVDAVDIEITETVAMERSTRVQDNVEQLTVAGVSISLDDFGTGYSSLSNLQAFPVNRLKVDGSFVMGIGKNRDDERIVEAVIRLGQSMGLGIVAEGVETLEQLRFLKNLGCEKIQGYLISKPLPPAEFRRFIETFKGPPL